MELGEDEREEKVREEREAKSKGIQRVVRLRVEEREREELRVEERERSFEGMDVRKNKNEVKELLSTEVSKILKCVQETSFTGKEERDFETWI